jgi:hypothetical protein
MFAFHLFLPLAAVAAFDPLRTLAPQSILGGMNKLSCLPLLLAALVGCSTPSTRTVTGWSVQAPPGPTEALLMIKGPTAQVAEVIRISGQWGWRAIDRADSPSGSTFILMAGPTSLHANEQLMDLLRERGLTFGPAITNEARFQPAG